MSNEAIETKSNKTGRTVETQIPDVLKTDKLSALVEALGEEMCVNKIQAQLKVDFRSKVRSMLEAGDLENEDYTYAEADIAGMDFSDWKPETRVRKSAEEKAAELLSKLSPDQIKAALAKAEQG